MSLAAAGETDFNFHAPVLEVQRERHEGVTLARHGDADFANLVAVEKKFALALGFVVRPGSLFVFRDVNVVEECLSPINHREAVDKRSASDPQRFHFSAHENEARLINLINAEVVARLFVLGYELSPCLAWHNSERLVHAADLGLPAAKPSHGIVRSAVLSNFEM